jgi:hypothetical protein
VKTKRQCSHERTSRDKGFGVAGSLGADLAKLFEIIERKVISSQVKHGVLKGTGMSVAQHKSISIDPFWI